MKVTLALTLFLVGGLFVYDGFKGKKVWDDILAKVRG